jgi:hypothetical protein
VALAVGNCSARHVTTHRYTRSCGAPSRTSFAFSLFRVFVIPFLFRWPMRYGPKSKNARFGESITKTRKSESTKNRRCRFWDATVLVRRSGSEQQMRACFEQSRSGVRAASTKLWPVSRPSHRSDRRSPGVQETSAQPRRTTAMRFLATQLSYRRKYQPPRTQRDAEVEVGGTGLPVLFVKSPQTDL